MMSIPLEVYGPFATGEVTKYEPGRASRGVPLLRSVSSGPGSPVPLWSGLGSDARGLGLGGDWGPWSRLVRPGSGARGSGCLYREGRGRARGDSAIGSWWASWQAGSWHRGLGAQRVTGIDQAPSGD